MYQEVVMKQIHIFWENLQTEYHFSDDCIFWSFESRDVHHKKIL